MSKQVQALFLDKKMGFFIYLIVEGIMFAVLFATYIVYTPSYSGPKPQDVYSVPSVLLASVCLLSSSATLLLAEKGLSSRSMLFIRSGMAATFSLGAIFLFLEINEYYSYATEGYTFTANNFLSSFYILTGLHAVHVLFGLLWMVVLTLQSFRHLPYALYLEKQKIFHYYWHFVDVVWLFIICVVYIPYIV
ncbi:cytochrome c oxidase subunit 3 [Sediminibacillus halophilus]|uniref:Cytochrome c oxidase subunit 3/cytochrome o ubiquinol oxidase subunit 3 n=1 Tax=Sediminibacillus halophilus TaxID=482461 RepID=A0A1G9TV56_9BACI|nr:cytochrome c oxidase subunit 3 [Sediminibacillus halophilus]SDM51471.1 cytochrome c oxidase subunit 3/cytochrome o ubiquinol oxidase subunit 3 [Sediminibacillus halophilus]